MGNCCGSNSVHHHRGVEEFRHDNRYKLPKIIVTSQDSALIYLEISPTFESKRLRKSLQRKFPNLVACNNEKRIFNQIEMMKERKYYILIIGNIREETLRAMFKTSKIKAIYFSLEPINLGHYSKSPKLKGFFQNQTELKQAIYYDMRKADAY